MTNRLTQLEILAADDPDILTITRTNLDRGKSCADIAAIITSTRPTLILTKSTVDKFRKKRWLPERSKLAQDKQATAEASAVISASALDRMASALLFQTIRTMTPAELIGLKRLKLQKDRLRLAKTSTRKASAAQSKDETATAWEKLPAEERNAKNRAMANKFREIFGLCPIEEEQALHEKYPEGIPTNIGARVSTTISKPRNGTD